MSLKLEKVELINLNFKELSQEPGVYIFFNKKGEPLYVGKAKNLKIRLRSYFREKLFGKTLSMIKHANSLSTIEVRSELEALLLEAKLVKRLNSPFNIQLKDDKQPLYIKISKEKYPRIITARKSDIKGNMAIYGPFPNSESVRVVLRIIRGVFPYSQHKIGKRACLYKQLGLCNPCPNEIEAEKNDATKKTLRKIYFRNIKSIKNIFDGKLIKVRNDLLIQMNNFSKNNDFENAIVLRNQIQKIDYITQPIIQAQNFLDNPNLIEDLRYYEMKKLYILLSKYLNLKSVRRIECYDVAHLSGTKATASMVTFIDGVSEKKYYRHFKILQKNGNNDISSLSEVAERRIKYLSSWGKPDLIIVDGGKGQVSAFNKLFSEKGIPVIGLAKKKETLVIPQEYEGDKKYILIQPKGEVLNLIQRIRNEAHRFARVYHHKLLIKSLLNK